ncbi:protein of unknown function [Hyphomicrobium sp. 1Nfss2.1]
MATKVAIHTNIGARDARWGGPEHPVSRKTVAAVGMLKLAEAAACAAVTTVMGRVASRTSSATARSSRCGFPKRNRGCQICKRNPMLGFSN